MKNNSFTISLFVFIIYMLASCRTEYIPVESVRYDSIYFSKLEKDSIFIRDSVHVREKGDTVFRDKLKFVYRYVIKNDTIYIEKRDSVSVPYPVEKKLTRWQQFRLDFGDAFIKAAFVYALYILVRWLIRKTRKE